MGKSLGCLILFLLNSLSIASTPTYFPCEPSQEIQKQIETIESKSEKFEARVANLSELLKIELKISLVLLQISLD